jgi:SPP1 family predicted phage head-tail adaptor
MTSIAAGRLRHRVQIDELQNITNSFGETDPTWVPFAERWAAVEPLSGREFLAAEQTQSEVSVRITIRYTEGLRPSMRVIHRGQRYDIKAILADKESGIDYQTLMCAVGVNEG